MPQSQTIDYDALAKQYGAVSSQPSQAGGPSSAAPSVDYDALAKRYGATSSTPAAPPAPSTPNQAVATGTISEYHPDVLQRVSDFFSPFVEHLKMGGAAKDERLLAPEKLMTPEQQEAHPIVAGVADVAGGMTTGKNLALMALSGGLGEVPGVAGQVLPRVASAMFSTQTARDIYNDVPDFRAAYDRGDASGAMRIFTHITLGAAMAALGAQHAIRGGAAPAEVPEGESPYEGWRQTGGLVERIQSLRQSRNSIQEAATKLYQGGIQKTLQTITGALRNDAASVIKGAIDADKQATMVKGQGTLSTAPAVAAMTDAQARTGASPALIDPFVRRMNNNPWMDLEQTKQLRTDIGDAAKRLAKNPSTQAEAASLTAAYDHLGKAMRDRITELQGTPKPFDAYNQKFRTYYKMRDGIAGDMEKGLAGREESIPQLEKFASANLDELKDYAEAYRVSPKDLDKLQEHAKAVLNAHESNGMKFASVWSALRKSPGFPTVVGTVGGYLLGHALGVPGFILAGAGATAGAKLGVALKGYPVVERLNRGLPEESGRILPKPSGPQSFDYPNQDDLYGGESSGNPQQKAAAINAAKRARGRK